MSEPDASRHALIVGGSLAGLFAAHALRQIGWTVQVFERSGTELDGRGAGIVTHPQLWAAMRAIGLPAAERVGVQVNRRITLDRAGRCVGTLDCAQTMTSWNRMFRELRETFPPACYTLAKNLVSLEQDDEGVTIRFADGGDARGQLLIGADGLRSSVRATLVGDVPPDYAGYVAWRGLVEEAAIPPDAHRAVFGDFGFCLPPGEQFLGYPVAGADDDLRPGRRRYNFVWYRPADEIETLPRLLRDASGRVHAVSIPPPLIRPDIVTEMRRAASRVLAPQFAAIVQATERPFLQPIYDLVSPLLARGRVALLGDSAFVVRPHVGAGVTKAAEDALALAGALGDGGPVASALRRYEAERRPAGQRVVRRARHLGAYLQAQRRTQEETAAAARHRTAEAVMAETALLDF